MFLIVAHLQSTNMQHSTIRSAVSALNWAHRMKNCPTLQLRQPRLSKVLLGLKRVQEEKSELLGIDRNLLHVLCQLSILNIPCEIRPNALQSNNYVYVLSLSAYWGDS